MAKCRFALGVAILLVLITPSLSLGQAVFGNIFGTVTDPQGAAVPNATVTVTDEQKGTVTNVKTNESGNYQVTHLIPDTYSIKVEAPGFSTFEQKGIPVAADTTQHVDAQVKIGERAQTVEVTGAAPQLQTESADVATTYNDRYVADLPVLNRNFTQFELLSPGTQQLAGWNHAATENPQGGKQIFVNGQHFSGTAFELDGTDNQDAILGIIVVNPNLDAITEAKVALQDYDAEIGKAIAGVVTAQTKSGTNDLHGSGFWFRRTDALQARDPFTQYAPNPITHRYIPPDHWNQYGGTIGGPIIKNKLFFFGDYQGTKEVTGVTNLLTVPTLKAEQTCTAAAGVCDLSDYLNPSINGGGQIYYPNPGNATGTATSTIVPGNLIPVSQLSPQAVAIMKLFPAPTNNSLLGNYVASGSGAYKQNSFDTRIDYTMSSAWSMFGRFSLAYFNLSGNPSLGNLGGIGFGPGPGLAGTSTVHNYSLAIGATHVFSPSLVGDFRFGWFRYNPQTAFWDQSAQPANAFGIPGLNIAGNPSTYGLPYFNLGGNNQQGNQTVSDFGNGLGVQRCNCPLTERENEDQWVANFTKTHGNHLIKWGGDFRYATNLRIPSDQNRAGELTFAQNGTSDGGNGGLALATFLFGDVTHFDRYASSSLNASEHQYRFFTYGQDTWRITPKLTLNLGLRWELYTPEAVNAAGNGGFANIVQGIIRVAGYGPYGLNGNITNNLHSFAPRFGIAYQLQEKTVIRAGFGMSYDMGVFGSNFGHTVTQNLPVLISQQVNASTFNGNSNSDSYAPAFNLGPGGYLATVPGVITGAPAPVFPAIPSNGQLPLQGPNGQVSPRVRPLTQVLPYIYTYNVTLQHQLTNSTSLQFAYVGNIGRHVFAGDGPTYNVNQPYANGVRPLAGRFTYPGYVDPATGGVLTCCNQDIGNYFGNAATSNYNALQVEAEKRFTHGLQFITHFTWSRALFYDANYFVNDPRVAYGPDDQNRPKVWVMNVVYDLPFGKGRQFASSAGGFLNQVIGGWEIANTTNWSSGLPFTATLNNCGSEINSEAPCRPNKGTGTFPLGTSSLITPASGSPYIQYFNPTTIGGKWTDPGAGNIGNAGFDNLYGPSLFSSDASIAKDFLLTERFRFQFRMDVFNLFNHVPLNFSNTQTGGGTCVASGPVTGNCGASNGRITDIAFGSTMREVQFGLHLFF
ncbi:MAG TPA: TonB-dependent receptor [Terriglobales bacterium]|nr:TonB-dependent receptor [Terriglobales bacterium]